MTAQRVTTMAFIVVLTSSVGFSQVKTTIGLGDIDTHLEGSVPPR
jgi:hypothetical protein